MCLPILAAAPAAAAAGGAGVAAGTVATGAGIASFAGLPAAAAAAAPAAASGFGLSGVLSTLGTVASVIGGFQQYQAQKQSAKYAASVDRNNQIINERAAKDVLERGRIESSLHQRDIDKIIGTQRAALAAHGVEVGTGTAAELEAQTAEVGALERANIEADAERSAYNYRVRAMNAAASAEANVHRARSASILPTVAEGLTGAGKLARRYGGNRIA